MNAELETDIATKATDWSGRESAADLFASNPSSTAMMLGAFRMGMAVFGTCFAGFLTLGVEMPAALAAWSQLETTPRA